MQEEWHRMLALQKRKCMIYSLKEKEGMLRLYHRKESIAEAAYCSYFGLRQKSYRFEAETAGLVLYQNHENHLRMEIAKKQEQKVFRVVTCIKGTETKAAGKTLRRRTSYGTTQADLHSGKSVFRKSPFLRR